MFLVAFTWIFCIHFFSCFPIYPCISAKLSIKQYLDKFSTHCNWLCALQFTFTIIENTGGSDKLFSYLSLHLSFTEQLLEGSLPKTLGTVLLAHSLNDGKQSSTCVLRHWISVSQMTRIGLRWLTLLLRLWHAIDLGCWVVWALTWIILKFPHWKAVYSQKIWSGCQSSLGEACVVHLLWICLFCKSLRRRIFITALFCFL